MVLWRACVASSWVCRCWPGVGADICVGAGWFRVIVRAGGCGGGGARGGGPDAVLGVEPGVGRYVG